MPVPATAPASDAAHGEALLEVRGLALRFRERRVLDGLDFSVRRGEIFGLLGPNGSGKSTTFRILTGLLVPDAGTLVFDGAPIAPGDRRLRRRLGVVFQNPSVDIALTCRENLLLTAALHRVPRGEAKQRAETLLELADLADRADEVVKNLSGGMRRRLELARSLIHRPSLLIMDEPTTGLDEISFHRTWDRLQALRRRDGLTILLTTHRPEEAAQCDRLALIDRGVVIACDTPENLQRAVSGDVITVSGDDRDGLAAVVRERFGLEARQVDDGVSFVCERGHELIPRLVEAFPAGRLRAVNLKRPSLADVFLKLTGHELGQEQP
jgi:ABC-2 type transport system ATP-binding protein